VAYTSTWAGLAVRPVGLLALVAAPSSGANMNRLNLRLAASLPSWCSAAQSLDRDFERHRQLRAICDAKIFARTGHRFFFLPLNQILMSGVAPNELASASGVSNLWRTMSGSFATAITVVGMEPPHDYHHAVLTEHIRNSSDA